MLFEDSNRGVPDFWMETSTEVEEISICEHGIHFMFSVRQGDNPHVAALVFLDPTVERLSARLAMDPSSSRFLERREHFASRYAVLFAELERISGGAARPGLPISFRATAAGSAPILHRPGRGRLDLEWNGVQIPLRGYLDVYLTVAA